jgi:hypothetical protein
VKEREDESELNVQLATKELLSRALDIVVEEIADKRYSETAACISRAVERIDAEIKQRFACSSEHKRALLLCVVVGKTMTNFGTKMTMFALCEAVGINVDSSSNDQP